MNHLAGKYTFTLQPSRTLLCGEIEKANLLVRGLRLRATVDLQANDAAAFDLLVLLRVVDGELAVEPQPDARPFAANRVLVPVVRLHDLGDELVFRLHEHFVAP